MDLRSHSESHISRNRMIETKVVSASHREPRRNDGQTCFVMEFVEVTKLSLPIVFAQVGQITMMTTNLAFIGQLGPEAIAAAAMAERIFLLSFTFGAGLLAAIVPLSAQAFGANNLTIVRGTLRMGLWAGLVLSFPFLVLALLGEQILLTLGQEPTSAPVAQQYLLVLTWGVAPALWFLALRNFMSAVGRPEPVLWITIAAIPLNAVLVYLMIAGKCGLPRLELFGAGLATTVVNCATFLAGSWFVAVHRSFRNYHVFARLWKFDWHLMRQLIVVGLPISMSYLISYGLSLGASLLAGLISTRALAAHQIAFHIATILSMIPFGVSMAAAVRIAHAVSRDDVPGIKRAGVAAMVFGVGITTILMVLVITARSEIADSFLGRLGSDTDATAELAAELLLVGGGFFIVDAIQSIAAGSLAGLKDTRVPLLFAGIAYWLVGFFLSYLLSLKLGLGAIGIWIGLSIGKALYAILLVLRFLLLTSKRNMPPENGLCPKLEMRSGWPWFFEKLRTWSPVKNADRPEI